MQNQEYLYQYTSRQKKLAINVGKHVMTGWLNNGSNYGQTHPEAES